MEAPEASQEDVSSDQPLLSSCVNTSCVEQAELQPKRRGITVGDFSFVLSPVDRCLLRCFSSIGQRIVAKILQQFFVVLRKVTGDVVSATFVPAPKFIVLFSTRHFN